MKLSEKRCVSCEGDALAFGQKDITKYLRQLNRGWRVIGGKKLTKEFRFKNFVQSMGFANQVALIAQAEDHHPDIQISYSKVVIELWTHAIGGLSENDFILAAKIDQLL